MLSIDEAIEKNRKIAETKKTLYDACVLEEYNRHLLREYKEHEQLAEWLEALKDYRDKNKMVVRIDIENMDSVKDTIDELSKYAENQYNKAIDDFIHKCDKYCGLYSGGNKILTREDVLKIAEQLRECKVDESTD